MGASRESKSFNQRKPDLTTVGVTCQHALHLVMKRPSWIVGERDLRSPTALLHKVHVAQLPSESISKTTKACYLIT